MQGAFSTLGEHFVNPDCVSYVSYRTEAELHYAKQLGYLLLPWMMVLGVFLIWKLYAKKQNIPFRFRIRVKTNDSSLQMLTPKDKWVVSICVLVYLQYPTLCTQGFALFNCIRIGTESFFLADLEEPCYTGNLFLLLLLAVS